MNEYFASVFTKEDVNTVPSVETTEGRKILSEINITEEFKGGG